MDTKLVLAVTHYPFPVSSRFQYCKTLRESTNLKTQRSSPLSPPPHPRFWGILRCFLFIFFFFSLFCCFFFLLGSFLLLLSNSIHILLLLNRILYLTFSFLTVFQVTSFIILFSTSSIFTNITTELS